MKKLMEAYPLEIEERQLDAGEMIKLRLEMVFQSISRHRTVVRLPREERIQLLRELNSIRKQ